MSGVWNEFQTYPVLVFSLVAALTDLCRGKIYNWLTLPAILLGIGYGATTAGFSGATSALLGVATGLSLYGWMFWFGTMGGGDIKLLMALGAWSGPLYAFHVGVLGIFTGGALALLILLFSGKLVSFIRRMYRFVLTLMVKELELETPKIDRKLTMPFGIPIAIAAVWVKVANPLEGFHLW